MPGRVPRTYPGSGQVKQSEHRRDSMSSPRCALDGAIDDSLSQVSDLDVPVL